MRLVLDITRTVARARLPAATGIDRVERAYVGWALGRDALFLCRVGRVQHLLGPEPVARLVRWLDGDGPAPARDLRALRPMRDPRLARAEALVRGASLARAPADDREAIAAMLRRGGPGVYLNVGHDNLSPAVIGGAGAAGLSRLVLVHDVIPLEHPEFARPGTPVRFRAKLRAAAGADLLLVNSADTGERLRRVAEGPLPPVEVAPLGIDPPRSVIPVSDERNPSSSPGSTGRSPSDPGDAPVEQGHDGLLSVGPGIAPDPAGGFVCLGTIEPRKNHALLLGVWDRLWRERGEASPVLHLVGRRGWSNEAVFRRLDTAPFMGRTVIEHRAPGDDRVAALLGAARALLFPSFAEGFGLPLAEALAMGVPVVASDLPALREVGGGVPDWLSPHDPAAWLRAVADYDARPSPRREAQLARLAGWRAPCWEAHFRALGNALETILVQAAPGG